MQFLRNELGPESFLAEHCASIAGSQEVKSYTKMSIFSKDI